MGVRVGVGGIFIVGFRFRVCKVGCLFRRASFYFIIYILV